ncbi:CLUMA_CG002557, isoform A, partial [Clunio marinus]
MLFNLSTLLDLSLGKPNKLDSENFNLLHTFLHILLKKLDISDMVVDLSGNLGERTSSLKKEMCSELMQITKEITFEANGQNSTGNDGECSIANSSISLIPNTRLNSTENMTMASIQSDLLRRIERLENNFQNISLSINNYDQTGAGHEELLTEKSRVGSSTAIKGDEAIEEEIEKLKQEMNNVYENTSINKNDFKVTVRKITSQIRILKQKMEADEKEFEKRMNLLLRQFTEKEKQLLENQSNKNDFSSIEGQNRDSIIGTNNCDCSGSFNCDSIETYELLVQLEETLTNETITNSGKQSLSSIINCLNNLQKIISAHNNYLNKLLHDIAMKADRYQLETYRMEVSNFFNNFQSKTQPTAAGGVEVLNFQKTHCISCHQPTNMSVLPSCCKAQTFGFSYSGGDSNKTKTRFGSKLHRRAGGSHTKVTKAMDVHAARMKVKRMPT